MLGEWEEEEVEDGGDQAVPSGSRPVSGFQAEDVQMCVGGGRGQGWNVGETCGAAQGPRGLADGIPGALGPAAVSPSPPGPLGEAMLRIPAWPGALPRGENSTILALGLSDRAARALEAGGVSPLPARLQAPASCPSQGMSPGVPEGGGVGYREHRADPAARPGDQSLVTSTRQVQELGLPPLLGVRAPGIHETP